MSAPEQPPDWVHDLRGDDGVHRTLADGLRARIFAGRESMLSVVEIEPHSTGRRHSHPEEQWGVLIEGECIRIQGDEEAHVEAGDFWHTPPGVEHAIETGAAGALVLDVFSPPRPDYRAAGSGFGGADPADGSGSAPGADSDPDGDPG